MNAIVVKENTAVGETSVGTEMVRTRTEQEVQAAVAVAQKFPRNESQALARILESCRRPKLAEQAAYAYPRGNETVTGPSIRLAETIAQRWGNIDCGWGVVEQRRDSSTLNVFAWDMENNTRKTMLVTVPHVRATKKGNYAVTDPRDVYELCANAASRRLRACILAIVPPDVVEAAFEECERTMERVEREASTDMAKRLTLMLASFAKYDVTPAMIEAKLGKTMAQIDSADLGVLRKMATSIKDGVASAKELFGAATTEDDAAPSTAAERLKARLADGQS